MKFVFVQMDNSALIVSGGTIIAIWLLFQIFVYLYCIIVLRKLIGDDSKIMVLIVNSYLSLIVFVVFIIGGLIHCLLCKYEQVENESTRSPSENETRTGNPYDDMSNEL